MFDCILRIDQILTFRRGRDITMSTIFTNVREMAIKNGQSRETGHIVFIRYTTKTNTHTNTTQHRK